MEVTLNKCFQVFTRYSQSFDQDEEQSASDLQELHPAVVYL